MKNLKEQNSLKEIKKEFNYRDPFLLEEQLYEDEVLIRNTAREFAQKELQPQILEANRNEVYDSNLFKKLGLLGLLGAQIKGYGCSGVSSIAYGLIAKEIERVDSAYRSCLSVQSSLVMQPINDYGNETQKAGIPIEQLDAFYNYCSKDLKLNILGLMAIPPNDKNAKKYFKYLNELNKSLALSDLSMGMSEDYLGAVSNEATFVRIGSSIFGSRF